MTTVAEGAVPTVPSAPTLPTGTGRLEHARLGSLPLADGGSLPDLVVAYRHDGPPPGAAPQVVVVHALTGSADAAGDWREGSELAGGRVVEDHALRLDEIFVARAGKE